MRRALVAIMVLAACRDVPTVPPAPSSLVVASGDHQTGVPGYLLADQIGVRLLDENGHAVVGDTVVFSLDDTTGILGTWTHSRSGLSVDRVVTGADGVASTQWRLGQTLGTQTASARVTSVPEVPPATISVTSAFDLVTSIRESAGSICAINAQKQLGCWLPPRLDGPVVSTRFVPVVSTAQFTQVVITGTPHNCALATSGRVWCFTLDAQASVQQLTELPGAYPALVTLSGAMDGAPGYSFCGLTVEGQPWCWGTNSRGEVGDGTTTDRTSPTAALTTARFVQMDVGALHSCALTAEGDSWCWGSNGQWQSGQPADNIVATPAVVVSPQKFTQVLSSDAFSCGVGIDRALYCWGDLFFAGVPKGAAAVKIPGTGPVADLAVVDPTGNLTTLTPAPALRIIVYQSSRQWRNPGLRDLAAGHGDRYVCGTAVSGSGTLCQYVYISDVAPYNLPQVIGVPLP